MSMHSSKAGRLLRRWDVFSELRHIFRENGLFINMAFSFRSLKPPQTCTVITLQSSVGQSRSLQYQGITFEFSRIAGALFFGFTREGRYDLATPEKALLDLLYLRGQIPFSDELEISEVDFEKLHQFSTKFPKIVQKKISPLK